MSRSSALQKSRRELPCGTPLPGVSKNGRLKSCALGQPSASCTVRRQNNRTPSTQWSAFSASFAPLVWLSQPCRQRRAPGRPNPSLERTATGLALGPLPGVVHHPSSGPSAIPASARSAQTLGLTTPPKSDFGGCSQYSLKAQEPVRHAHVARSWLHCLADCGFQISDCGLKNSFQFLAVASSLRSLSLLKR